MPDASLSVHPRSFAYENPIYAAAARAAKDRSRGRCQMCGRKLPLEAHHFAKPYPPAHKTSPNDLTGLCHDCHDNGHDFILVLRAGGSPAAFRAAVSEAVATVLLRGEAARPLRSPMRTGRAVWFDCGWGAIVSGESRPRIDEVIRLFLVTPNAPRDFVVTAVVDGRPDAWRVRTRFRREDDEVRPMCVSAVLPALLVPRGLSRSRHGASTLTAKKCGSMTIRRHREADARVRRPVGDGRVPADLAADVQRRPAGVAGVDRRVGL